MRTTGSWALLALAIVATTVLVLAGPAGASSAPERRLQETRERLSDIRTEIEAARAQRDADAAELAEAERQLAGIVEVVADAERAVVRQEETVEAARRKLAELEEAERRQRRLMARRAAELYRRGSVTPWSAVLAAGSTDEVIARSTYVEIISRADLTARQDLEIAQVAVDAQREELEAEEAALRRVLEQHEEILAEVQALRDERALVLAGSEETLRDLQARERHLEVERRELTAITQRASRTRVGRTHAVARPAGPSASGWAWPAQGPITSEYGMRWGRLHEGIDIGGSTGAPVVASRGGAVVHAGRLGGYGNLVVIDHGDGHTSAYAHLSSISVGAGQRVDRGQRIGGIGCTGSCTGPHLHFEIRVNGAPQNPRAYLP